MKTTELRIGNWVYCNDCSDVAMEKQVDLISEKRAYAHDWLVSSPIPLTEEWLVKFGFGKKMASVTHTHSFIKGSMIIGNPLRANMHYNDIKLKHVHQLQNLYFTLKGEEL